VTGIWTAVGLIGVSTILIKAAGPVLFGGRELPPRLMGVVRLLAPALLAALVATQVFGAGRGLVLDERALGVSAALVALALRAPVLVVVAIAATTTAIARLIL
jgi:branched-subunit amino acid transport protein